MVDNSTKIVEITQNYFSHKKGDVGVIEGETTSYYTINFNDGNLPCLVDKKHVTFISEEQKQMKLDKAANALFLDMDVDELF